MKKILSVVLCMMMLCASFALAEQLANPMTAVASLEELNNSLFCKLTNPAVMGVTDEQFFLIETGKEFDIGEYSYNVNGIANTLRFCADYENDISGVYVDGKPAFEGMVFDFETVATADAKLARWATIDGQYCLCVEDKGELNAEQFEEIAREIMDSTTPMNEDEMLGVYAELEGFYMDSYSQRANAEIVANGSESVSVTISWSSSAFESDVWAFNAVQSEDGMFYYNDCEHARITSAEDGSENVEILEQNGEGYFAVSEGRIFWTGAADEACRECVFEIYED